MMEFTRENAEALLAPCRLDEYFKIDERGIWPAISFDSSLKAETNQLRWRPAQVFAEDLDSPDVESQPALPFPFDARQLAAFMLDGVGYFVAEYYGEWVDGPDPEGLAEIPDSQKRARAAVKAAFDAYREAKDAICCPEGEWPETDAMVWQLLRPKAEPPQQDAVDHSMLATRGQLIEAFGRFTGMNASWFSKLKDSPALFAARKVIGQGGRGHLEEPWFCPFEVMQWLANPKRRKGNKLSEEKAWALLEKSFPTVYNAHSVADPRQAD